MVIEGIPYARYDVIAYVIGDPQASCPPMLGAITEAASDGGASAPADTSKKRKKKKKKSRKPAAAVIPTFTANGVSTTFPAITQHNRINGAFTEITADNPGGNVVILRGVTGATCTLTLDGAFVGGLQIVEAK